MWRRYALLALLVARVDPLRPAPVVQRLASVRCRSAAPPRSDDAAAGVTTQTRQAVDEAPGARAPQPSSTGQKDRCARRGVDRRRALARVVAFAAATDATAVHAARIRADDVDAPALAVASSKFENDLELVSNPALVWRCAVPKRRDAFSLRAA